MHIKLTGKITGKFSKARKIFFQETHAKKNKKLNNQMRSFLNNKNKKPDAKTMILV